MFSLHHSGPYILVGCLCYGSVGFMFGKDKFETFAFETTSVEGGMKGDLGRMNIQGSLYYNHVPPRYMVSVCSHKDEVEANRDYVQILLHGTSVA